MPAHEKIDYVEYPTRNLPASKAFFQASQVACARLRIFLLQRGRRPRVVKAEALL